MYRISKKDSEDLRKAMKEVADSFQYRKMLALALRGEGKKNEEIAEITRFHADTTGRLAKKYLEGGLEALLNDGRKGGNHRNVSDAEEQAFISEFEAAAEKGQLLTVSEIAVAYDKRFGKEHRSKSTVYYLLHKQGFRKVMPRSKHPKSASPEAIEASKELKQP